MKYDYLYLTKSKEKLENDFQKMFVSIGFIKGKVLRKMIRFIMCQYNDIPFHNIYHIYEVCEFVLHLFVKTNIQNTKSIHNYKKLCLFAAICHDIGHKGVANRKCDHSNNLKNSLDIEKTFIINNILCNENIHLQLSEVILKQYLECFNISLDTNTALFLNNVIIATDISLHTYMMSYINNLSIITTTEFEKNPITYSILFLKLADLSHTLKPFKIHCNWVFKINQENNVNFESLSSSAHDTICFIDTFVEPLVLQIGQKMKYYDLELILKHNKSIWINYLQTNKKAKVSNGTEHALDNTNLSSSINIIDRISCTTHDNIACTIHKNACICMLDIVNFSQWCSKQNPVFIFETMTKYNSFLNDKINIFDDIEKVELVGDSVLIVGGLYAANTEKSQYTKHVIHLCNLILSDIKTLQKIFNDNTVSLRIGVHNGDVYSGYIMYPKKFQLFGNSINIASRLESTCLSGTMNISLQTYTIIEYAEIMSNLNIGKTSSNFLKGVGLINSKLCFIETNKVLIADDVLSTCKILSHKIKQNECEIVTSFEACFDILKRSSFNMVFLDRYFDNHDVFDALVEFRIWESKYKSTHQKIVLMTSLESNKSYEYFKLYVDEVIDKQHNLTGEINRVITQNIGND